MNKYDKLLLQIASELNICRGETESDTSYKARLIYSAVSRIGYSSLWDILEDDVPVSIIHFRRRVENVLGSYIKMYPEVEKLFPEKFDDISKEMLDIFTNTGIIYHSPNRIAPSVKCQADFKSISFLRGTPLSYKINLSGTGAYLATDEKKSEISSVRDMFGLSSKNITDIWEHYLSQAKWSVMTSKENFEYLRTKPKFTSGYWTDIPDKDGKTSLMRTNLQGLNMYFFTNQEITRLKPARFLIGLQIISVICILRMVVLLHVHPYQKIHIKLMERLLIYKSDILFRQMSLPFLNCTVGHKIMSMCQATFQE